MKCLRLETKQFCVYSGYGITDDEISNVYEILNSVRFESAATFRSQPLWWPALDKPALEIYSFHLFNSGKPKQTNRA